MTATGHEPLRDSNDNVLAFELAPAGGRSSLVFTFHVCRHCESLYRYLAWSATSGTTLAPHGACPAAP